MLFLGNSYTFQGELDQVVAALFADAGDTVEAARLANPGWRFVDHLDAIETPGTDHAVAFAEPHDWVFLQEQSQIPGFPEDQADRVASVDAAVALDGYAAATGAQTMFVMTWGRREGDDTNPDIYPDFQTMQVALGNGYLAYVEAASADGTPAYVAPAGLAFARVYDDVLGDGGDPLAPDSPFWTLYVDDGSHPSARGTYLAACVVYASVTGRSPEGLEAPASVSDAAYLQSVATDVVFQTDGILVYPWSEVDDTGSDTGPIDDTGDEPDTDVVGDDSAGDPESADSAEDIAAHDDGGDAAGCGCASGGGGAGWLAVGVGAVALGRRRKGA